MAIALAMPGQQQDADAGPRPVPLPALREELHLHQAPPDRYGAPRWTLEDPARNRFFQIGWPEMEMLARWDLGEANAVAAAVAEATTLDVDVEDVEQFAKFLAGANLLQVRGPDAIGRLVEQRGAQRMGWSKWLLKNYLFVRIPLVRPDPWLEKALPHVAFVYTRGFFWLTLLAGLVGLILAGRQWDSFTSTFMHFFTLEGAAIAALTLSFTKVLHELGHAFTAKRYGCRVSSMGVALLVMFPVLYTDTSAAWKLRGRQQRLAIGAAGMASELALACYATLAWSFLPDGMLRSAAFMVATTTWLLTLAVNTNPFMRFDGYFLLSDLLDVANLQDRSFALGRWRLREALFGLGEEKPEVLPPRLERLLTLYAYGTWIYRFFLFLGIALLVYHFFFKLLGIFLFIIELAWFIGMPVWKEMKEWSKRRTTLRWNAATLRTGLLVALGLGLLLLPWGGTVRAPALLRAAQQNQFYAPAGAQLAQLPAAGGAVQAGEPLFRLVDPLLDHRLANVDRELLRLRWQNSFLVLDRASAASLRVVREDYAAALEKRAALLLEKERLTITAPFDGVLADMSHPLASGEWVAAGEWLGTLVMPGGAVVEAYVGERDLKRLEVGAEAHFIAEAGDRARLSLRLDTIATAATTRLAPVAELASLQGGGIAALPDPQRGPVPEQAVYRVLLTVTGNGVPAMVLRGQVHIDAQRQSIAGRLLTGAIAVLRRESGF
ncbi:HlyD family efflux transporter periplasmic adaptor subunit [Niveispirillum fermenti]|uniref:HlyD family efflux transporter periplasmic adaptor subunit n=1 Tax=Niveispirillum fermenti TaxID=1233113 RepID=UPI003A8701AF